MKTTRFTLELGGDCQGEPPNIYLYDHEVNAQIAKFFFDPIPLVKEPNTFEDGHWDFPELCKQTVQIMNEYA